MPSTPRVPSIAIDFDDPPFLTAEPPPWAVRSLAWFVLTIFVVAAAATVIVRVPETVVGRFVLVPVRGTDPIRVPRHGQVTAVRVSEGDVVARGAPLVIVRSDPVSDLTAELNTLQTQLRGADDAERNARAQYESTRSADEENRAMLEAQLASAMRSVVINQRQHRLAADLAARFKRGADSGLISGAEYTQHELDAARLSEEVSRSEGDSAQAVASIAKLEHEMAAREAGYHETLRRLAQDRAQATIRVGAIHQQLTQSAGSEQVIASPCAGTVLRLRVQSSGAVVQEGDFVGEVACTGEHLHAELTVPQSGIGRMRPGQPVKLLYDAFPYQRFGVRHGQVRWVSPAASASAGAAAPGSTAPDAPDGQFRALVDIDDSSIRVDGRARQLLAGMAGEARVVVDHRSLVSYVFEPIRELRESLSSGSD